MVDFLGVTLDKMDLVDLYVYRLISPSLGSHPCNHWKDW